MQKNEFPQNVFQAFFIVFPGIFIRFHRLIYGFLLLFGFVFFDDASGKVGCTGTKIVNFTKGDYEGDYQNWSIDIGKDNYVYVANMSRLLVYDGISWESYYTEKITNLRCVQYDSSTQRIYSSGYREIGYWEWDNYGYLKYNSLTDLAASKFVKNEEFWNIHFFKGNPVFHSYSGLFIYTDDDFRIIRTEGIISGLSAIGKDLFVFVKNKGVYRLSDVGLEPFLEGAFFQDNYLVSMFPWGPGRYMLITARNGIYIYDGNIYTPAYSRYDQYFRDNSINRAYLLNNKKIIIGTLLNGISLIEEEKITLQVNQDCGLINNTVLGISGNKNLVWLALDRGISLVKFEPQKAIEYYQLPDIGAVYCGAIFRQQLYLGTNQGLYVADEKPPYESFSFIPETQGQTWDCKVVDGTLFVGHNSGTFLIQEGVLQRASIVGGGFNIIENPRRPQSMLQSTYSYFAVYIKEPNGQWAYEKILPGFTDLIRYIEFDQEGNLWASHMRRAVYKLRLNNEQDSIQDSKYYGLNGVFQQDKEVNVFKIKEQVIFTTGKRLFTYDPVRDSIIPHERYNNMLGEFASSHRIVAAGNQFYWMISEIGVALYDFRDTKIKQVQFFPASMFSGKIIDGFENIIPLDDYRAIYCLTDGIAILNAEINFSEKIDSTNSPQIKRFVVYNIKGEGDSIPISLMNYRIPAKTDNISIDFAYPSGSHRKMTFHYKIIGLNNQWKQAENPSQINVYRLPHGSYQIEIVAEDIWKNRSKPLIIALEVLRPWYISYVAWSMYIIILFGLILYFRYRFIKALKDKEKKRIEKNEQELAKLRNQNLRTELSLKSRELANSTMAIIKKNEFLMKLKEILKRQKADLGSRYPDKYYLELIRKIEQNISRGDDWKVFETNLKKAHELFLQKMIWTYPELTQSDLRLCAYLRMNLTSKEIAPLMRVSVRAVENHRYRLRKKLKLNRNEVLNKFIIGVKV
jgi:DNA-binding CsgD family transcriptional regulator